MVSNFKLRRVNSLNSIQQTNFKMQTAWLTQTRLNITSRIVSMGREQQGNNRYDREYSGKFVSFVQIRVFNLMFLVRL